MTMLPYPPLQGAVEPEWIDFNGHMNVAYYVLIFDRASDRLLDHLGIGVAYRRACNRSVFTLEAHVTYQHELHAEEGFVVDTRLVDLDRKRLHIFHMLLRSADGLQAAACEFLATHVDLSGGPHAAPLPDEAFARAQALFTQQRNSPLPQELGRRIGIRR